MAAPRKDDEPSTSLCRGPASVWREGLYRDVLHGHRRCMPYEQIRRTTLLPRKEMLLAHYIDDHFSWVIKKAQDLCPPQCDVLELLCMMGFIHLGMLIKDEEASPLVPGFRGIRPFSTK